MSLNTVIDFIEKYSMLSYGDKILAAVSGGADSVCMLNILLELRDRYGLTVFAAHFNHMLRNEESDRDEAFVKALCSKLSVPLYCGRGDVSLYAKENSLGTEEAAREMRYSFLYETAASVGAPKIATAHNADDNAETVILNLTRGSGLSGLRGIPPVRDNVIRPVLCLTRQDVEDYLSQRSIEYVTDSTNLEDIYTRNKLRHHVMPVLRELNPRFSESVMRTCDMARDDEEYLSSEASRIISENAKDNRINASLLLKLPKALSTRIVRKMAASELSSLLVSDILALCSNTNPSARLDAPGLTIHREYDDIVFGAPLHTGLSEVSLTVGESVFIPELNLEVTIEKTVFTDNIHKTFTDYLFKTTDVYGKISIRSRITGDKIKLRKTNCTKSLKKLFIEKCIPAHSRDLVPVISDDRGVLGVYGLGCDVRGTPDLGDTIYIIHFKELSHI